MLNQTKIYSGIRNLLKNNNNEDNDRWLILK